MKSQVSLAQMSAPYSTQELKRLLQRAQESDIVQILLHSQVIVKIKRNNVIQGFGELKSTVKA